MSKPSETAVHHLCEVLEIEDHFLWACLDESVIDVYETDGRLELTNGTALRLRRLQRICLTFNIDVPLARLLMRD